MREQHLPHRVLVEMTRPVPTHSVTISVAASVTHPSNEALTALLIAVRDRRDRTAFEQIFAFFAPRLRGFVKRRGSGQFDPEDIVQDVMIRIWVKAAQFDERRASALTWIFTITRNYLIDTLRKGRRSPVAIDDAPDIADDHPTADFIAIARQSDERLRLALTGLPRKYRDLLQLTYFQGTSYREAARLLDIPEGTVKSRLRMIFLKLRGEIGDDR